MDPRNPDNQWWPVAERNAAHDKSERGRNVRLAARAARKAASLGVYLDPRAALEMAWRVAIRARYGSYMPY